MKNLAFIQLENIINKNFKLELWQKAFLEALYGFYDKKNNLRRFKEALLIVGRGNGKTALASAIALKSLILDNEANAELLFYCNQTRSSKKSLWRNAKNDFY
ncbi:hypothetical protein GL982_03705 [Spiroplasma citri]|uniref:terminase large subunit domain-containing protein n=1 Tax=Spiroplasma citri TaxID=2133 RepID=UPI0013A0945B|nr:terminase large subunit [Spiroplasma citri]QIA72802.1 hypothetical protein GL982_03705 [Spiroplasma citri]